QHYFQVGDMLRGRGGEQGMPRAVVLVARAKEISDHLDRGLLAGNPSPQNIAIPINRVESFSEMQRKRRREDQALSLADLHMDINSCFGIIKIATGEGTGVKVILDLAYVWAKEALLYGNDLNVWGTHTGGLYGDEVSWWKSGIMRIRHLYI
ncbi:hypothetical protein ACJX0J_010390, partial [Zea mays]